MSTPEPTLPQSLTDPSLGASIGYGEAGVQRRGVAGVRSWLLSACLFLLPVAAYWPATFHDSACATTTRICAKRMRSPARFCNFAPPTPGRLRTAAAIDVRTNFHGGEFALDASGRIAHLGAIAWVMFRGLCALGWSFEASLGVALMLGLLPASQVIASWAVGWPYAMAALLALGAFFAVENALTLAPGAVTGRLQGRLLAHWLIGLGLLVSSALIYQPSALFYVVPLAAAVIAERRRGLAQTARWAGAPLVVRRAALALAYSP